MSESHDEAGSQLAGYVLHVRAEASCCAAQAEEQLEPGEFWVLWDSGSDEHLCRRTVAHKGVACEVNGPPLYDVQGNRIADEGGAKLQLLINDVLGNEVPCQKEFRVSPINENVFSAGKVIRAGGFKAVLDCEGSYLEAKDHSRTRLPLYLRRNSFYLKGHCASHRAPHRAHQVCPVSAEPDVVLDVSSAGPDTMDTAPQSQLPADRPGADLPLPSTVLADTGDAPRVQWPPGLHPASSVAELRAYLNAELMPTYGTKHQLFERACTNHRVQSQHRLVQSELRLRMEDAVSGAPNHPAFPLRFRRHPARPRRPSTS